MSNPESGDPSVTMDWDTYWRGSVSGHALAGEGVKKLLAREFWQRVLDDIRQPDTELRLLDVASGTGAVIEAAFEHFADGELVATSLDASESAIASLTTKFPAVEGSVGDANDLPFPDDTFDLVTSQFGVEYAGVDAVFEMLRVARPGGRLLLLMHAENSVVARECSATVVALDAFEKTGFLTAARTMFEEGRKCVSGEAVNRETYDESAQAMLPLFTALNDIIETHGERVAGGTLLMLFDQVDRIHSRIMQHDLNEVVVWMDRIAMELVAYRGRMQSMLDSALPEGEFRRVVDELVARDVTILEAAPLSAGRQKPIVAWSLVATKAEHD